MRDVTGDMRGSAVDAPMEAPKTHAPKTHAPKPAAPRIPEGALQMLLAFASLIALIVFFSLASPNFLQTNNVLAVLQATAVNGVLATGVTFVIITGGIDLSIGILMTFTAVIAGVVLTYWGMPLPVGVLAAIGAGALCGACSGFMIAHMRIPPFIATLGMMLILKGLSLVISGTKPIYFNDTEGFSEIATGSLTGSLFPAVPLPNGALILFVLAVACAFILHRTLLGRYCFALGANEEAVRLSGVDVKRWKIYIYMFEGAVCGLGGLIIASRLNSAQPSLGLGYELDAIAAVVIGGTSLAGGRGTITGTMIGALITGVLLNGLRIMSVAPEWQTVVEGLIIIGAVYADVLRREKLG